MNLSKNKLLVFSLIFLMVMPSLVLLAQDEGNAQDQAGENQVKAVATVNGAEITQQELSQRTQVYPIIMTLSRQYRSFAQFLMTSQAGSNFLTEYRKYVLDLLIEQELQNQKMDETGITASNEEVQEEIDKIIENNDQFKDRKSLENYLKNNQNMTMENLVSSIKQSLRREKLREEVSGNVSVSEEEISAFYESNKSSYKDQEGNVKPLEEVRTQIKETLKGKKRNKVWSNWLQKVKEEANIEKNPENL
ncbi:peptidylprolyl isomerase [Candidatus Bipolaricaulota bacterium]|nr:peptidylprolyl isomerase [Candidatus Bipolaricaulota bacterium]